VTGQSRNSIGPFGPLADHPTTQVGPSEILEATYDRPSIEGLHKYSWLPKAQDKYHDHNSLGDESKGSCVAEFVGLLRPNLLLTRTCTHHRRGKLSSHLMFLNVIKIFNELLKNVNIKLSHTIPSIEELKRCTYCKWHDSFLHNTNDSNVFRWQIEREICIIIFYNRFCGCCPSQTTWTN
jgi:hypothetical protein